MKKGIMNAIGIVVDLLAIILILLMMFLGGAYYGMHTSGYGKSSLQKQLETVMTPIQEVVFPGFEGLEKASEVFYP